MHLMRIVRTKFVAIALATTMAVTCLGRGTAQAMMVPVDQSIAVANANRAQDMKNIQAALENKMVQQRLRDFGLTQAEVNSRLGRLSDEQIHQASLQIEKQNPAGDATGVILVAVLVVLFVVLIASLLRDRDHVVHEETTPVTAPVVTTPAQPATAPAPTEKRGPDTIIVK